jgi:sporulation protein YlmC with PRC-barrel domain
MNASIKKLYGNKLGASDGLIGHVNDVYFDDTTWVVRYLVADTGTWLSGRPVLLPPRVLGKWDRQQKTLAVNLTRTQVENSPSIDAHRPVSRQYELEHYEYYGWPVYWIGDGFGGLGGFPGGVPVHRAAGAGHHGHNQRDDVHLRSVRAVTGYQITALDGAIGHVHDLRADLKTWNITDLVVEAWHWYAGEEILIAPSDIERISYEQSTVMVRLTKDEIQRTADHALAKASGAPHDQRPAARLT